MEKNNDFCKDVINNHDLTTDQKIAMLKDAMSEPIAAKINQYEKSPFSMLTTGMTGKMLGMNSISTSCTTNKNCQRRIEIAIKRIRENGPNASAIIDRYLLPAENKKHISCKKCVEMLEKLGINACICIFCYANGKQSWQHDARIKFAANGVYLSKLIHVEKLPIIPYTSFRIEAEGDVETVTQCINYINLINKNPHCIFAVWTKNPGLWYKAFLKCGKPENLVNMILSSRFVNVTDVDIYVYYNKLMPGMFTRLFTVYTRKFAIKNGIILNCCKYGKDAHCITCENSCYKPNDSNVIITTKVINGITVVFINEVLR